MPHLDQKHGRCQDGGMNTIQKNQILWGDEKNAVTVARLTRGVRQMEPRPIIIMRMKKDDFLHMLAISDELSHRPISKKQVSQYLNDIREKRWKMEVMVPILVDGNFRIWDGRHRITAFAASGLELDVPFEQIPDDEDPNDYLATRNVGRPLRAGDLLRMKGESNATELASVLTTCWSFERGTLDHVGFEARAISPSVVVGLLKKHPRVRDSVTVLRNLRSQGLQAGSSMAFCHYILGRKDPEARDAFFESLRTGANLKDDHPILRLRRRLLDTRISRKGVRARSVEVMALIFKAWNMVQASERCQILVWKYEEDFPIPVNCGPWPEPKPPTNGVFGVPSSASNGKTE